MKLYNSSGYSGILAYEIGDDFILIKFKNSPHPFRYEASKIGNIHFKMMKYLAENGRGLSSYINKHPEIRDNFTKEP